MTDSTQSQYSDGYNETLEGGAKANGAAPDLDGLLRQQGDGAALFKEFISAVFKKIADEDIIAACVNAEYGGAIHQYVCDKARAEQKGVAEWVKQTIARIRKFAANGGAKPRTWTLPDTHSHLYRMLERQGEADEGQFFQFIYGAKVRAGVKESIIIKACLDADPPYGGMIYKWASAKGGKEFVKAALAKLPQAETKAKSATNSATEGWNEYQIAFADGPETSDDELPKLYITSGNTVELVDKTVNLLVEQNKPIYQRAGKLVQPIYTDRLMEDGRIVRTTRFVQLDVDKLRYFVGKRSVRYFKMGRVRNPGNGKYEPGWVETDPPDKMLKTILAPEHWAFRQVRGIITAPTLRNDGSVIDQQGYDKDTQLHAYWHDKLMETWQPIPEQPTEDEARAALQVFIDLLKEVAFVSDLDKSVALAAILSGVLRGAFRFCPLVLFLASVAGTGKSYLADIASNIANGRDCPVITSSKDEPEMEKRLASIVLEGSPIISLDNLSFDLSSDLLNQMCTQDIIKPRILGKSRTPDCEWRGVVFATGNNVALVGDLTRRGLICNLYRDMDQPEEYDYKRNPITDIRNNRGLYLRAAMIIAKAYLALPKDKMVKCSRFGGFEEWSRFVREPLIWLGLPDPVKSQEQARKDDPKRSAARELIALWKESLGTSETYRVRNIIDAANATKLIKNQKGETENDQYGKPKWEWRNPELQTLLLEQCGQGGKIDSNKLGKWLRSLKRQRHDGYRITPVVIDDAHGNKWKLVTSGSEANPSPSLKANPSPENDQY